MASAVALVRREGWTGLGLDNEIKGPAVPGDKDVSPQWDPRLPSRYAAFVGNLSRALERAGRVLVSDVTSTWRGDLGGPEYIPEYARAAPSMRVMDMATYFNGLPNGFTMPQTIANLSRMMGGPQNVGLGRSLPHSLDLFRASSRGVWSAGIGAQEQPGHENASCSTCGNVSDPKCGCLNYKWNSSALASFVRSAEAAGASRNGLADFSLHCDILGIRLSTACCADRCRSSTCGGWTSTSRRPAPQLRCPTGSSERWQASWRVGAAAVHA